MLPIMGERVTMMTGQARPREGDQGPRELTCLSWMVNNQSPN